MGAMLLSVTLIAAACGSDKNDSGGTATPGVTNTSVNAGSSASGSSATGPSATGSSGTGSSATASSAGGSSVSSSGPDRSGQTIKIGLVNEDNGVFAFPEFRVGAETAFKAINDAGGIHGAKIELVSCSTNLTPETSVDCANKLVEANVAVAFTAIDLTSDAALPVYQEAGIPYVTSNNWGQTQATAKGSHLLHVATEGLFVGAFALAEKLGVKKLAFLYEKNPANDNNVNNIIPPIADAFKISALPAGVDGASPDWTAAVATAQAGGVEMIYGQNSEPGCTAMVQAVRDAKFDVPVGAGACSEFMTKLGDDAVGVYTMLDQLQPSAKTSAPPNIAAHITEYEGLMAAGGNEKYTEGYAVWSYGAARELGEILQSIEGDITPASAETALNRDVVVPGWMGPDLNCGAHPWPSSPAHCSATIAVYKTEKGPDGKLVRNAFIPYFDAYEMFKSKN